MPNLGSLTALLLCAGMLGLGVPAAGAAPGDLDSSFGHDGIKSTGLHGASAVVTQPNDRILIGGMADIREAVLVRLRENGTRDRSFSGDGEVLVAKHRRANVLGLALQGDGGIVAHIGGRFEFITRITRSGRIDRSFGENGAVQFDSDIPQSAETVGTDRDDRIVVGSSLREGDGEVGFAATRLAADGSPDTSFSQDGVASLPCEPDSGFSLHPQSLQVETRPDGAVFAAAVATSSVPDGVRSTVTAQWVICALTRAGEPNPGLGGDGNIASSAYTASRLYLTGSGLARYPDGPLLVHTTKATAGERATDNAQLLVARYQASGEIDTSFGDRGFRTMHRFPAAEEVIPSGGGTAVAAVLDLRKGAPVPPWTLVRFERGGALDPSFGKRGIAETRRVRGSISDLAPGPGGTLLAAGIRRNADRTLFEGLVLRYELGRR